MINAEMERGRIGENSNHHPTKHTLLSNSPLECFSVFAFLCALGDFVAKNLLLAVFATAGMGIIINVSQMVDADLGVFLGCRQGGMAKQFLNRPQIGAAVKQMGGKRMAQGMRGRIFQHTGQQ